MPPGVVPAGPANEYSLPMPAPEFRLKITPPRLPRTTLDRGRLMQIWDKIHERTAIAVAAPAGFGKTTLLLQWRRRWLERNALVAWLGADNQDQPVRFATGLLQALHLVSGRKAFDLIAAEHASRAGQEIDALTVLLAEVALLERETVLIIDDAERLPKTTLHRSLRYLLLNAPANLHVVIGSRVRLPLHTTELVAKGNLAVLVAEDLRLRLEESIEIIERRLGARLDLDQRAQLHDLTEGWPVGLQLAIAKVEQEDDPARSIATISARREGLQDYFIESMFSRMSMPQRSFLVRTAILEHLNAELCEAVTGCVDAPARLEQLLLESPIMMVGETSDWVRLHPLGRDFLLGRFEQLPRAEQTELHLRASRWLAGRERFHEAARHALAAGDEAAAHGYAARSLWLLGTQGKLNEAREWLDRIPPDFIAGSTLLRLVAAWVLALGDDNAQALRTSLEVAADPAVSTEMLKLALRVAGGAAAYADEIGRLSDILARWPSASSPTEDPVCAVAPLNARALLELHAGSSSEVQRLAAQVATHGNSGSLRLAEALARLMAGLGHLRDGHANRAEALLRPALARAEKEDGRRSMVACMYAAVLAAALLERNELSAAQALLANRIDVIEASFPDTLAIAYHTLTRIALGQGDERRALNTLDNFDALAKHRRLPRLQLQGLVERIRIHALDQRLETVGGLLQALERFEAVFQSEELQPFLPQYRLSGLIARAYAALAGDDMEAMEQHLVAADLLARQLQRERDGWTIKVLRAVALRQRDPATARAWLSEALALASLGGHARLLADTHPLAVQMGMAWHDATADGRTVRQPATANEAAAPPLSATEPGCEPDLLTAKESEVLHLLQQGLSNKLIARNLDISSETVKWHLKNLFLKLSAGTRWHAVERARLLGLVDNTEKVSV